IDPDRILQRVAEKYQADRERLVARGGRSLHARNVAMWMIWETGNKSLREIGELFGGLDYAPVAQRIRRTRSSHDSIAARELKATMFDPNAPLSELVRVLVCLIHVPSSIRSAAKRKGCRNS